MAGYVVVPVGPRYLWVVGLVSGVLPRRCPTVDRVRVTAVGRLRLRGYSRTRHTGVGTRTCGPVRANRVPLGPPVRPEPYVDSSGPLVCSPSTYCTCRSRPSSVRTDPHGASSRVPRGEDLGSGSEWTRVTPSRATTSTTTSTSVGGGAGRGRAGSDSRLGGKDTHLYPNHSNHPPGSSLLPREVGSPEQGLKVRRNIYKPSVEVDP